MLMMMEKKIDHSEALPSIFPSLMLASIIMTEKNANIEGKIRKASEEKIGKAVSYALKRFQENFLNSSGKSYIFILFNFPFSFLM
mmetsp:Transcript_21287/g.55626  ORF Transcript_21287/g.55626 Transcript_21287/m.55626 type:complete len:85 (+) Transcript_21287:437-691(+)